MAVVVVVLLHGYQARLPLWVELVVVVLAQEPRMSRRCGRRAGLLQHHRVVVVVVVVVLEILQVFVTTALLASLSSGTQYDDLRS